MPLTNVAVRAAKPADKLYRLSDGKSLYLKVSTSGRKSWEFRYKSSGTVKAYVIGPYPDIGLSAARDERDRLRREMQASGVDPLTVRKKGAAAAELALEQARAEADRLREERSRQREHERVAKLKAAREAARQRLTVEALLLLWEQHKLPVWSDRSRAQIMQHAIDYVVPVIGQKPVADLRLADALAVVDPLIADGKVETARRVRQRLGELLDYGAAHHHVSNNVVRLAAADLKDHFERAHRDHPEQSHPTIPMAELPQLLRAMRTYVGSPVTRSLMWLIALTACRTGEARYATWAEFRLEAGLWEIPAQRMKAGRHHTVYLPRAAVDLLRELNKDTGKRPFVFAHPLRDDRPVRGLDRVRVGDHVAPLVDHREVRRRRRRHCADGAGRALAGVALPVPFLARLAREVPLVRYFKIEVPQAAAKLRALIEAGGDAIEGPFDGRSRSH